MVFWSKLMFILCILILFFSLFYPFSSLIALKMQLWVIYNDPLH